MIKDIYRLPSGTELKIEAKGTSFWITIEGRSHSMEFTRLEHVLNNFIKLKTELRPTGINNIAWHTRSYTHTYANRQTTFADGYYNYFILPTIDVPRIKVKEEDMDTFVSCIRHFGLSNAYIFSRLEIPAGYTAIPVKARRVDFTL